MTHPANPLLLLNEVKKEKGGMEMNLILKVNRQKPAAIAAQVRKETYERQIR